MTITTTQPLPKTLTFEEYLEYEGEGDTIYELYQGQLIPMAQPTAVHTKICQFLLYQLQQYLVQHNLPLIVVSTNWIIDPNKRKIWLCSNPNDEEGYQYQELLPGQILTSVQFNDLQMPVDLILEPPVVERLIQQEQESRQQLEQELTIAQERAEMERQRAERLAQRLRELNIDPDQL